MLSARRVFGKSPLVLVKGAGTSGTVSGDTWTASTAYHCAYVSSQKSVGKWYVEVISSGPNNMPGIARYDHTVTTWPPNGGVAGVAPYQSLIYYRGASGSSSSDMGKGLPTTNNQRRMFAVDLDAGKCWLGVNGTWYGGSGANNPGNDNGIYSLFTAQGYLPTGVAFRVFLSPVASGTDTIVQEAESLYLPSGFNYWSAD